MKKATIVVLVLVTALLAWATQWRYERATVLVRGLKRESLFRINRYTGEIQELTGIGWVKPTPKQSFSIKCTEAQARSAYADILCN